MDDTAKGLLDKATVVHLQPDDVLVFSNIGEYGPEAAEFIKAAFPDTKVIMFAGNINLDVLRDLVPPDAVGQYRADIARYEILHRYGGVYADLDTTCQRPIGPLLPEGQLVAGWEVQGKWIGNTVIAAPAGHGALAEIIAALPAIARRHAPAKANKLSGPKAITPLLRRRHDVHLLDQGTFYPVAWDEPERSTDPHPHAYVVHHWQHQRDLRGLGHP